MKSLRSILTTLVSLLVALVVLAGLGTLANFLLYSKVTAVYERVDELRTEQIRGGGGQTPASAAEADAENETRLNELLGVVAKRDADINTLRRELAMSMNQSRELEEELRRIVSASPIPPAPAPAGESGIDGPAGNNPAAGAGDLAQRIGLAAKIAQVQRYDYDYNFVVLDAGLDRPIAVDQVFGVRQARDIVARIRVTKVDENTSVAELIPGSEMEGRRISEGDDVISLDGL